MTGLLYISYSSGLSEDDKLIIDRQVSKNRETVCIFVKTLASNAKDKTRKVIIVSIFAGALYFNNVQPSEAIGLSRPPTSVVKVQPNYKDTYEMKVAPTVSPKLDKITFIKSRELPVCIYMMDETFLKTLETRKLINKVRGGSLIESAAALVLIIVLWQILGIGDSFVIPVVHPRNGTLIAPANGGVSQQINYPKNSGQITVKISNSQQVSTNVIPSQTQMSGFVKNGKIDLHKCFDEVNRRASEIECSDFECSMERFRSLATENGELKNSTAREAITILEGEMRGYYRNARRENYGENVNGLDFIVEGIGEFENITHVEVKNPVGSSIKIANGQKGSIAKQGKKIGAKIDYQQNLWSNPNEIGNIPNMTINTDGNFPKSPWNVLGLVDSFDVPVHEKASMEGSVLKGYNGTTNIVFLNNVTNV